MNEWTGGINLSIQQCCDGGSRLSGWWAGVSWWWRLPPRERCLRCLGWLQVGVELCSSEPLRHVAILLVYLPALILNKHPRAHVVRLKSLPVRGAEALLGSCASGHIHKQSVLSSQGSGHWGSCSVSGSICVILISPNLAGAYFPSNDLMLWGDSFRREVLGFEGKGIQELFCKPKDQGPGRTWVGKEIQGLN